MSATSLSEPEDERLSSLERWTRLLGGGWIFVLLIALIAIFTILRPEQFGSSFNLSMLAINAAILLVLSVGQTFVIIAGGIDLSVGTVLVFASITSAQIMLRISGAAGGTYGTTQGGWGVVFIGLIVALASGAFWGAVNGALVAAARIPPLIVTLGTFGMALGFAQIVTNGTDIRAVPEILVDAIGSGAIAGVPVLVVIAAAVALVGAIVLHLTRFGVHVFAVGSDKEAARRAGIQVGRKLVAIYVLSGTLAGLAAMMSTALRDDHDRRPRHGQPVNDLRRRSWRHEPVWRNRQHRWNRGWRVHPDRTSERLRDPRHSAVLANRGDRRGSHPRRMDRPAQAKGSRTQLRLQ
jgi:ribose transport system permease protein